MATSISRVLVTRSVIQSALRCSLTTSSTNSQATPVAPEFWKKNKELNRPMSPWHIYKPQLTSMLSITHRGTGLGLSILLYGWGVQSALASGGKNWEQTLDVIIQTFPHWMLYSLKVLVATSVGYHLINGIRHLFWDMGYGFTLKQLYSSGYFVIVVTLLMGVLAALNA